MIDDDVKEHLQNINVRLARVEQFLPTLATKAEVALLATKAEVALLATKAELAAAIAHLATKAEVREEGEKTRRHMDVVVEHITAQMAMVYESHIRHTERLDSHESRIQAAEAGYGDLDLRVSALERKSRRSR